MTTSFATEATERALRYATIELGRRAVVAGVVVREAKREALVLFRATDGREDFALVLVEAVRDLGPEVVDETGVDDFFRNGGVETTNPLRAVCSWCGSVTREGVEPTSHTICPGCREKLKSGRWKESRS